MSFTTYKRVSDLLQYRADLLMSGRFEDLARHYVIPLVTYVDGRPTVIRDTDGVVEMFRRLRMFRQDRGIVSLRAEVIAMDLPRDNRIRVWTRYVEIDSDGQDGQESECLLFLRQSADGLLSEMVECRDAHQEITRAA